MIPSDLRLLSGARRALMSASIGLDARIARPLSAVGVTLDELALRADTAWLTSHGTLGAALVQEGRSIAGERALPGESAESPVTIEALKTVLTQLVIALAPREAENGRIKDYLVRVVDWENQLYAMRAPKAPTGDTSQDPSKPGFDALTLQLYLGNRFPLWRDLTVTDLREVGGGFSKTTLMFDVAAADIPGHTLVVRAETPASLLFYDGAKIDNEYRVLKLLHAAGHKVAEPLWLELDATHFGVKFLVSRRAPGRNFGTAIRVNDALSPALLRDLMDNLHRIHKTAMSFDDDNVRESHLYRWLQYRTLTESTAQQVAYWSSSIAELRLPDSPLLQRAIHWLSGHVPVCDEPPCLIHRDYGLHNLLIDNDQVSCVLDWENATVGDPAEDLAWIINGLAGAVDRQTLLDIYGEIAGKTIPERRVRFFEVFNSLKYAVTCLNALALYERNPAAPLSLCEVGLRFMHHGTRQLNEHIESAERIQRYRE